MNLLATKTHKKNNLGHALTVCGSCKLMKNLQKKPKKSKKVGIKEVPIEDIQKNFKNTWMKQTKKLERIANKNKYEKKALKRKAKRNTILAGAAGIAVGSVATYLVTKNLSVQKSDYTYSDDTQSSLENSNPSLGNNAKPKDYVPYDDGYQISTDGTTLVKNNNQ